MSSRVNSMTFKNKNEKLYQCCVCILGKWHSKVLYAQPKKESFSLMRAIKSQISIAICTVWPKPSLLHLGEVIHFQGRRFCKIVVPPPPTPPPPPPPPPPEKEPSLEGKNLLSLGEDWSIAKQTGSQKGVSLDKNDVKSSRCMNSP